MCCRKNLIQTGNPLISNIESIQPERVFLE
ncbi:hypothetical protein F383_33162 [Gossypium arboreum]|uniref:Uncharacterized protein n=1 Tax=Gossypium arboreum TaxID=29729 RepID=A0A0B0PQ64_GOSAR|nr:hypothetical protein F383_28805 [Gossypium arboreum]KHG26579.1 hypothetical protein F383_33162 [Gossypium arboreum]